MRRQRAIKNTYDQEEAQETVDRRTQSKSEAKEKRGRHGERVTRESGPPYLRFGPKTTSSEVARLTGGSLIPS